jgi:hypothetical protein
MERRKGERAWVLANPGPASYGKHEAVMWTIERTFAPAASNRKQTDGSAMSGIAASAGEYTGPVRVIRDETEFGKIQSGDFLVLPHYLAGLVDPLRQCRRPGDRYGGHPFPLGDHRPGVSGSGGGGDRGRGKRPSFDRAGRPSEAEPLYGRFVSKLREAGLTVETGRFQTHMEVELVNDGRVTILLDSEKGF